MTASIQAPQASGPTQQNRLVLPIVAVGVLLASLDLFIVNVALPNMAADLEVAKLSDLSWILNAYTITFAALLVPAGRIGDRVGLKPGFVAGLALFVASSAACAATQDLGLLVLMRILQAVGGAIMIPTSLGLVLAATPPQKRAGAVRLWVAMGGLGAAMGPVVGGVLVEASWRWVFLVNVPLGIVVLLLAYRTLPSPARYSGALPGLSGTLLFVGSITALVTALVNADQWTWTSTKTVALLLASVVGASLFARTIVRSSEPVVDLALLRAPNFSLMTANSIVFNASFGAMLLSSVLWLQQVWGWSAIQVGLGIAPGPVLVPLVAVGAGGLIARFGAGPVMAAGGLFFAAGVAWWSLFAGLESNYATGILIGMLMTGIGVGLALPTSFAVGTAGLPAFRFATGSAVLSMARQVGIALGVAVLVAQLGTSLTPQDALDSFRAAWWTTAALAVISSVVALRTRTQSASAR